MDHLERPTFPYDAARYSFWGPFVLIGLGCVARVGGNTQIMRYIMIAITVVIVGGGICLSIYALLQMRHLGRTGILGYAATGLVLNLAYIGLILSLIPVLSKAREKAQAIEAERQRVEQEAAQQAIAEFAEAEAEKLAPKSDPNAVVVRNKRQGYRLELPPGFEVNNDPNLSPVLTSYVRTNADETRTMVNIHSLGGTIGTERMDEADLVLLQIQLPEGHSVTSGTSEWGGHTVNVLRISQPSAPGLELAYGAQLPLLPSAIQVTVVGPTEADEALLALLQSILDTVEGRTNWK